MLNVVTIRLNNNNMNTIQVVHIICCFFLFWLPLCQKIIPRCEKQWDVCLSTLYIKLQPKSTRNRGLLNSDKIYICYQGGKSLPETLALYKKALSIYVQLIGQRLISTAVKMEKTTNLNQRSLCWKNWCSRCIAIKENHTPVDSQRLEEMKGEMVNVHIFSFGFQQR